MFLMWRALKQERLLQLDAWGRAVQNVPVRAQPKLHSFHLHPGCDLHRTVLCHHPPHHLQADPHSQEASGMFRLI
jgi:hypothetical protein